MRETTFNPDNDNPFNSYFDYDVGQEYIPIILTLASDEPFLGLIVNASDFTIKLSKITFF